MALKTIFPVTRLHEPLRVDVEVQNGRVVDAWVSGHLFRGMEIMLTGRDPRDVSLFTQRICGICSSAHAMAATLAQRQAFGVSATPNGTLLTNVILIADLLQNHLRHFYALVLYDYVQGPDLPPWVPRLKGDYRLPKKANDELLAHARQGLEMSARAHEMMAIFGAKAPHQQTIMPTGITESASPERLMACRAIAIEIRNFVEQVLMSDILVLADYYRDYFNFGTGYGNLLSYGMLEEPVTGKHVFPGGIVTSKGAVEPVDERYITEAVRYSWYIDDKEARHPREGITTPDRDKTDAYTWVKSPRYKDTPYEGGPLARAWTSGEYRRGVSAMDRLVARVKETVKLSKLAIEWLDQVTPYGPTFTPFKPPQMGNGAGLMDTMRGALGHWMSLKDGKVSHYQIVTPTAWNFSPRDNRGQRGPVEEALIGTPVADPDHFIEVGRVIRSFDPCFSCAIHVINGPKNTLVRL